MPTTSKQSNKRKRLDTSSLEENLRSFMCSEKEKNSVLQENVKDITNTLKTYSKTFQNTETYLRRMYRALENVVDRIGEQTVAINKQIEAINNQTEAINRQTVEISKQNAEVSMQSKEVQRHNMQVEKQLYEKNKIKKQCLEIQRQQLEKM